MVIMDKSRLEQLKEKINCFHEEIFCKLFMLRVAIIQRKPYENLRKHI